MDRDTNVRAYLALAAGALCIGWSAIFVKLAGVPGPASAFYRMLVSGLVLVPWRLAQRRPWPARPVVLLVVVGGVFYVVNLALWNTSLLLTSAAVATLLANNAPLWVGLGTLLVFRQRLSGRYWLGLLVALSGMLVLMGVGQGWHGRAALGAVLAVGASLAYAVYLLTTQRARAHVDTLSFMTLSTVIGVAVLWVMNVAMRTPLTGYAVKSWLALAAMGLVSQLGGWLAINYALGHIKAAHVSVTLLSQAVIATLLAMPLLGEIPRPHQIVGGAIVLSGIYLVNQRSAASARAPAMVEGGQPTVE